MSDLLRAGMCYVSLFHGRDHPKERLSDWGVDGPIIGPVGVSWTYGSLKLHSTTWDHQEFVSFKDHSLVYFDGMFYGDFEILPVADENIAKIIAEGKRRLVSFDEFAAWVQDISKIQGSSKL